MSAAKRVNPMVLPGRRTEFAILLPIAFVYSCVYGMITVLVPLYSYSLGAREALVGLIVAVSGLLQVLLRAPCGVMAAATGSRMMFFFSFASVLLAGSLYLILPGCLWFFLPQLFFGLASAAFWPSQWAYASELCHEERRSSALGYTSAAVGMGSFLGPYLGGFLADRIGPRPAFMAYIVIGLVGFFLTLRLPAEKKPLKLPGPSALFSGALHDGGRLMAIPEVFQAVVCMLLAATTWGINNAFYAIYAHSIGYTATIGGALLAVHGATSAFTRLAFGALAGKRRLKSILFGATFLNAFGMFVMPLLRAPFHLGLVTLVSGIGYGAMYPAAVTLIADHTEGPDRVLGMGLFGTAMSLGLLLSPMIFGALAQLTGLGFTFHLGNLLVMLGTTGLFLAERKRSKTMLRAGGM